MGMMVRERGADPNVYTAIDCQAAKDGLTKQSFKDETDINKIIARFEKTGMVAGLNSGEPTWSDVSGVRDYKESLDLVMRAGEMFRALPALLRERFSNDPAELLNFLNDSKNLDEAVKLGIVVDKRPPAAALSPPKDSNDDSKK